MLRILYQYLFLHKLRCDHCGTIFYSREHDITLTKTYCSMGCAIVSNPID